MTTWHAGAGETITSVFARAAGEHPDRIHLDFSGALYTYGEVDRASDRLAHGLKSLGVEPGDTVASILDNNIDAVLAWYAINKIGAISVPVNTACKVEFLRHQIDDAGAKIVIAESDYAAPFPAALQEKWRRRFGAKVLGAGGYGFTEAAMVTYGPLTTKLDADSSGPMAPEFDVVIVDDDENPVPTGTAGEVLCRPRRPFVMFEGYWNRPVDTLKIMKNLWLHTGDIGRFGENGEFYFLDRKKDYLRRRGENISSFEMEKTFQNHPDIMDVAVHAVFSEMGEDDVKLTCVLQEGSTLTEAALCSWSLDKVPFFAVPRYIEFRQDLPRNPTGKVLKYQLRDEGCTRATWDREKSDFKMARR